MARSTPSSDHKKARPCAIPRASACMWMSQRIHSVGTTRANPDRVVETPPHRPFAERFGQPSRDVVADDRKRRGRWFEVTGKARPECGGALTRIAVERLHHPALGSSYLDTAEHAVCEHRRHDSFRALQRRWYVGRLDPGSFELELTMAESCVDGEDLAALRPDRPLFPG